MKFECDGLLAKAIQHEVDHLNGILFIDRMPTKEKEHWRPKLESMRMETQQALQKDESTSSCEMPSRIVFSSARVRY